MNLTIRKARESDRRTWDWKPYYWRGDGPYKPWVVCVDGEIFVGFRGDREVVYQNNTESVAPLVRVAIRYFDAMDLTLASDVAQIKADRHTAQVQSDYQDAMSRAVARQREAS